MNKKRAAGSPSSSRAEENSEKRGEQEKMWRRREHRRDVNKQNRLFGRERGRWAPSALLQPLRRFKRSQAVWVRRGWGEAQEENSPLPPPQHSKLEVLLLSQPSRPHDGTLHPATTGQQQQCVTWPIHRRREGGCKMDSRDQLELQVALAEGSSRPTNTHFGRLRVSHLTLSVHTHVYRVVPAQRAIHHGWSTLGVEVVPFRQAVERARFHATYTHIHTHTLIVFLGTTHIIRICYLP